MTLAAQLWEECEDDIRYFPPVDDDDRRARRRTLRIIRRSCPTTLSSEWQPTTLIKEQVAQFNKLTREWKRETVIHGNLSKIVMHPSYQRIMAMGPDIIPLILKDLSKEPAHWFWALHNLVPQGQDPAEGTTTIQKARSAWLEWGKKRGIIL